MYIARNKDGKLHIFATKPEYNEKFRMWLPSPYSLEYIRVEGDYPEVTFENSPQEVELVIKKSDMEKIIIGLTQEQINTMVHDSCVLFCKHCGCGIPRDTCTSLGTCKEHDEYRTVIRTHLMEKKKKEYPKTYGECEKVLGLEDSIIEGCLGYEYKLLNVFQKLLMCRDAYWKIAGEEVGLGKPWEPSDSDYITGRYCIFVHRGNIICDTPAQDCILTFPTPEMRDAFYENFKELIEFCKELL